LVGRFSALKTINVTLDHSADLSAYGEVVSQDGLRTTLRVPKTETSRATARLLADLPIADLTVEDPPIEDVIEQVFAQEKT
jgi:ABC-2 type transport system ATP-binding protein